MTKIVVSAHQPAYNPWLGYLHKILLSDIFVVMDDVQFEKNSFINRNKILQNSKVIMLTIPIKTKGYKEKTIKDMQVLDKKWKIKHLKSIEQAYSKSKYFDIVFSKLKEIYEMESDYLIDYTNKFLFFLKDYLKIDTKIVFASDLDIKSKKLEYVCELTHKVGGNIFVFGALGKSYADEKVLKEHNIKAYFQEYNHPIYKQLSKTFYPYMGVIDILFNEKKEDIKDIILSKNITNTMLKEKYDQKDTYSSSSSR